ncbi:MAG: NAD-dependent epimerase/dehydratase family protein [Rickettsiella sp.]|nr:NAD-dependent epimerase/dehydratase family protein [Rickettsiella sp.]
MRYFVTGCAGFIASHLVDRLLKLGHEVVGYDNFSTGFLQFLEHAKKSANFTLIKGDLLDIERLTKSLQADCQAVFHFAANADIKFGIKHPDKDLKQNTLATFNILEVMRQKKIQCIIFASTGSVYGEAEQIPTPENAMFPIQTSLYAASKVAAEALIQAYAEAFNIQAIIFRFVSVLGERYSHGHVFDFYKQLLNDPKKLRILGDGRQCKSYLYVQDCIDGILLALEKVNEKINIFNLGTDATCLVNDSIQCITEALQLSPDLHYSGGQRGWIGDNPFIYLDINKISKLGWKPKLNIQESVVRTVNYLKQNPWILGIRV